MRRSFRWSLALLVAAGPAVAAPPIDRVVPADATDLSVVTDLEALQAAWGKSQYGRLLKEPSLQPFLEGVEVNQVLDSFLLPTALGWSFANLKLLASGEVGVATVPLPNYHLGGAFIIDATGRADAVTARLATVAEKVHEAKGTVATRTVGADKVTLLDWPAGAAGQRRKIGVLRKDDLLVLAEPPETLDRILPVWNDESKTLAGRPTYRSVRQRSAMRDGETTHVRWYLVPFGGDRATRPPLPPGVKPKKKDPIALLRREGFDAIQAVGITLGFGAGTCDLIARAAVHAPGPFVKGMKLVSLRPGGELMPEPWVPADLAVYSVLRMTPAQSFEAFAGFFDYVAGGERGSFDDVLKGLKDDPDGPRVDVRRDIVAKLGEVVTVVTDAKKQLDLKSSRGVVVFTVKDAPTAALAVRNLMRNDANARRDAILGREVWVVKPQPKKPKPGEPPPPPLPDAALCVDVAAGQFYVANQLGLLERILRATDAPLTESADFQRIRGEWGQRRGAAGCWRVFSQPAEDLRFTYNMWRSGLLDKAESIYSQMLSGWQREREKTGRPLKLDTAKLPEYAKVAQYLGPFGLQITHHADGWDATAFVLPK